VATTSKESVIHLFMAQEVTSDLVEKWTIDSGATLSMTSRKEWFINYSSSRTPILIDLGNDSIIKAVRSGLVRISMTVNGILKSFELQNVYYVPDMETNNLLLVIYIVRKEYAINFGIIIYEISKAGSIIGKAKNRKGLWVLDSNSIMSDCQMTNYEQQQCRGRRDLVL